MTRTARTALLSGLALTAGTAGGQVLTESLQIEYDWDVNGPAGNTPTNLTFPSFDTMGGTRGLIGVDIAINTNMSLGMLVENVEEFSVEEFDWFFEAAVFMNVEFEGISSGTLGGWGQGGLTGALAANDGTPMEGPDTAFFAFDETFGGDGTIPFGGVSAFADSGMMVAEVYPFLSLAISAPPPLYDLFITSHVHFGEFTVTYHYSEVPAPASATLLGIAGLTATRRRR